MSKKHAIQCKYCDKVIHGGITRVKYHLANIGGFNVTKCKKVPAPVNQEMEALLTKKTSEKEQRKKEKQRERDEIDLDKSDGSNEEDNEHENDVIVLKSTSVSNNSSSSRPSTNGGSGTIDNFYKPQTIEEMDSDVPAMGFFHGCMLEAKKEIATRFDNNESKYRAAWDIIDKRWDNKLKTPLHLAEYYLNPYFYYPNKSSIELDGSFRAAVISCITKMFDDEDTQDSIIEELNIYQDQQGAFGHDIAVRQRRNKTFNPAKWWMNHGTTTPHLRILATRILNLTCSSSGYENVYQDEDHEGAHDEPSQEPSISKAQLPAKRKRHGHPRKKKLRSLKSLLSSDLERATCASSSESEDNESMQIEASNSDSGDE
ncbi:hAT transposon superfamily protein [Zea mays]|uniref:HAT transposon superfamily protein n=1 Tax=Zea mays TaxID=4577 RepID=A0A1D6LJU3_MAIZE|nr:hAT transposon superfamily protein [Zea mays]